MKMKKILILAMAVLLLTGCGESTYVDETEMNNDIASTEEMENVVADDAARTEESTAQGNKGYIGTFGEDVFFVGIDDYVGCEFDIP